MKCRAGCLYYQFAILAYAGVASHGLSSVFRHLAATRLKLFQSMDYSSVAVVRTGHRSVRRNNEPRKHDVAEP